MDFVAMVEAMQAEWEREEAEQALRLGITVEELRRREAERRRREERAREREEWMARHEGIEPPEVLEAIFDGTLTRTRAVAAVDRWLESRKPMLILYGVPGSGKTVASLYAIRRMRCGTVVRSTELGRRISPTYEERKLGTRQVSLATTLICVEDLGAERMDDRWLESFFALVDSRQSPRRRTVLTTNLTPVQMQERYDDRVIDRFRGIAVGVTCGTESMRGKR